MAVPIQNLRSGTATKRPVASGLAFGQVAVNYNEADPAIYLRGDANALIKVSPVFVGTGAPNATPASGGSAGNSKGEQWLDTASSPPTPKVWNGSAFVSSYTFTSGTTLIQPLVTSGTISGSTIINATISGTFTAGTITASGLTLSNGNISTIKVASFNSQLALGSTSGSITIDWGTAQNQRQPEPTGTITYTFTAPPGPCHLQLLIDSDGTSTAQTINWPGTVIYLGSTWSGANNKRAVINFWYDGTNYFAIGSNQA